MFKIRAEGSFLGFLLMVRSSDWINAIRSGVHASSDLDYLERVTVNC